MISIRGISQSIINRLPKYLHCLYELRDHDVERISSAQIANIMDTTASQVRQDFSVFGSFGATGYGYQVENLIDEIERILGLNKPHTIAVIGVGSIGRGLLEHMDFESHNYRVCGAFDIDPAVVGTTVNGIPVYHFDEFDTVQQETKVDICMLTVSRKAAREVAQHLAARGISAMWNFTNVELRLNQTDVLVQNVNLLESLFTLTYFLEERS